MVEEVKVAKTLDSKDGFTGFEEADLSGHIPNKNATQTAPVKKSTNDEKNLIREDYQLYAALTILKGLDVAQR